MSKKQSPGQRIRERRGELGISQAGLARMVGVSPSAISEIEQGRSRLPSAKVLIKMAEVLKVSQAWIITGQDGQVEIPTEQEHDLLTRFRDLEEDQKAVVMSLLASMNK